MSGDVQPRKRKDKKKKKDDLGTEETRGTAAALGDGDVFMHSYQDHGTGGHWCAKIIFFSLLAVLVTLIGLIILENRGLTELEANSVESRYSGVLEGWIEDAIDDHHDEHTLELKHHDDDEDHHDEQLDENEAEDESLEEEIDHNDEDDDVSQEHEDEDENDETEDEDDTQNDDDNDDDDEEDDSQNDENNDDEEDEVLNYDDDEVDTHNDEDEDLDEDKDDEDNEKYDDETEENSKDEDDEEETYEQYSYEENKLNNDIDENEDDDDVEEQKHDYVSKEMTSHYNYHESYEDNGDDESKETKDDDNESNEHNTEDEASEEDDQGEDDDDEQEIEKIEKEIIDGDDSEEITVNHAPASKEKRDTSKEVVKEDASNEDDEPPIEKISRPQAGKPFVEIEEEPQVKPVDTLAEEEAYERQQEELRRQEEEAPQGLWLKLCVGGALLAATHALVRRATRPDAPETEEPVMEETPSLIDRRMTIIDEPLRVTQTSPSQAPRQIVDEEVFKRPAPVVQSAPVAKPKIEEEIVKEVVAKVLDLPKNYEKKEEEKELYSEEEEEEDEDEDVEEDNEPPQKEAAKKQEPEESEPEAEPEEVSDVEIIYDETVEEEEVPDEEIEEEEISDVDDAELLSRLEAKYGRLPEPERPGQYKGGGNSLEAEWPGEPSDPYWRSQLDTAEEEFRQGAWSSAAARAGEAGLGGSGRARWLRARALDRAAESARDNRLLTDAVAAYLHLLKMNEALSDERLLEVARRTVDRIQFRGTYLRAEPVYRLLIRRFPDVVDYRNNLTVLFLMANRPDLADEVLKETLRLWPNDRHALGHRGFVLKTHYDDLEGAVRALRKALDGDAGPANEPRFYYHLGDALLTLGRLDEAREVHERGATLGHFLSASQRSLYNVPRLRARPWWRVEDTPYADLAAALEASWRDILKEGEAAVALYEQEKEGLKERGEWSQLDIFVRGREVGGRCERAPAVCAALRGAAQGKGEGEVCRRGQVKFSMMTPGTHVRPHVGPTNCRLRMHLALSNTEGTYIRVDKEIRQWQLGKTFIFDDSFEHEVWHNGTGTRLVLIVDVWHPDLTAAERRQLPAI